MEGKLAAAAAEATDAPAEVKKESPTAKKHEPEVAKPSTVAEKKPEPAATMPSAAVQKNAAPAATSDPKAPVAAPQRLSLEKNRAFVKVNERLNHLEMKIEILEKKLSNLQNNGEVPNSLDLELSE